MNKRSDSYYLENILSNIPEYVFWKDLNSAYVGCNLNFAKLAGANSIESIIGTTDYDLPWSQFTKDVYLKEDKLIIETKRPLPPKAVPLTGTDGKQKVIRISKAPLLDDEGEVVGILGVFHDITELSEAQSALLEQIEKTEEAYRSKTEFLSIMTHEIRNPVGNIIMYDGFLRKNVGELKTLFDKISDVSGASKKEKMISKYHEIFDKVIDDINVIAHESEKALDYLKCLGEIHRLQIQGINARYTLIKTENLLKGIIKDTHAYNFNSAEVAISIDPSVPKNVEIDYNNIYEALKIIVANALRFSNKGGVVKVHISDSQGKLKITVRDSGVGIAISQINDLFEGDQNYIKDPEAALYRKPSLRLTLAKMMIEASGGELKIERMSKGTRVIVSAPHKQKEVTKSDDKSIAQIASLGEQLIPRKDPSKHKILIVEDDPLFQQAERGILEGYGHSVSVASTGEDALKKLSKKTYDIVFLDITLPDINGIEIMKKVRKNNKELRIIVVTSHANTVDVEHFEEMGATLVLTKPVSRQQFEDCLNFSNDDEG